jgi:hypothetical protein
MPKFAKYATGFGAAALALVLALASVSPASAQDRRVNIHNSTSYTIVHFYASNVTRDNWEEDILGQYVLNPGGSVMVNVDDGSGQCLFDFKAVFDDGDEAVKNGVNVCEIQDFYFTE